MREGKLNYSTTRSTELIESAEVSEKDRENLLQVQFKSCPSKLELPMFEFIKKWPTSPESTCPIN